MSTAAAVETMAVVAPAATDVLQDMEEELELDYEDEEYSSDLEMELLSPGAKAIQGDDGASTFAVASKIDKAAPKSDASTGEEFNRRPVKHAKGTRTTSLIDDLIQQCKANPSSKRSNKRNRLASPPAKAVRSQAGTDVARFARTLCEDLQESKVALVRRAVDSLGVEAARALAAEVAEVEAAGGQHVADGSRRRTPGGVFWNLLKGRVTREEWDHIFADEREAQRERNRRRQARRNSLAKAGASSLTGGGKVAEEGAEEKEEEEKKHEGGAAKGEGEQEQRAEEGVGAGGQTEGQTGGVGAWARSFVNVLVGGGEEAEAAAC